MHEKLKNLLILLFIILIIFSLFALNKATIVSNLTLQSIDGKTIETSDIEDKVIVLNFWATDCSTCIKEMPELVKLYEKHSHEIALFAIAMPYDIPSRVVNFSKDRSLPFDVILDTNGKIIQQFQNVKLTPTTIIIDKNKRLSNTIIGDISYQKLRDIVAKLL